MDLVASLAEFTAFSLVAVASIIAVMNPASTIVVYTALTEGMSGAAPESHHTSMKIAFIVLAFALTGQLIFSIFNITVPAFQIAGGILLVSVATGMLNTKGESYSPEELENIAVVPLAFPLSCGPGTITTVILLASGPEGVAGIIAVFAGIIVALAISYIGMLYGPTVFAYIGEEGLRVVPKLLAVIVLAIAIQFIINGISAAMPQLLGSIDLGGLV